MAATADPPVVAEVHVAGPVEREPRPTRAGRPVVANVQRCLRCDALVAEHSPLLPIGTRVALAPTGGRVKRYVLGGRALRDGEADCHATPFPLL